MRVLIVNADDLGASPGITRGILEAHTRGIVTSASLMVDTPWSAEAAALARLTPALGVGLHVDLAPGAGARDELRRQYARFATLVGRAPTHIDSHHNVHREAGLLDGFLELSRDTGLPLRGHSRARYFPKFYGQWGGESHPEQVSVESLLRMLDAEIADGITELSCHPGYVDARVPSGYTLEREVELHTLCDPRVREGLAAHGITLSSFRDLGPNAALGVTT